MKKTDLRQISSKSLMLSDLGDPLLINVNDVCLLSNQRSNRRKLRDGQQLGDDLGGGTALLLENLLGNDCSR